MSTSTSPSQSKPRLIHVGSIKSDNGITLYLLLRQKEPQNFVWYERREDAELETPVRGTNPEEAIRQAYKEWGHQSFRPLECGFLYTLPERDEHGVNALFAQMVASYLSPNGVFFDEDRGHNCFVDNASQQALKFWKQLEQTGKL